MDENSTLQSEITTNQAPDSEDHTPRTRMQIGKTTYLVGVHFNPDATETLTDKIKRLIIDDVKHGKVQ